MKLLVAGGQRYLDRDNVRRVLDMLSKQDEKGIEKITTCNDPGACYFAREWASEKGVPVRVQPIPGKKYRSDAIRGHVYQGRDRRMIQSENPGGGRDKHYNVAVVFTGDRWTPYLLHRLHVKHDNNKIWRVAIIVDPYIAPPTESSFDFLDDFDFLGE